MALPFFFEDTPPLTGAFTISESNSRHISQVLRKTEGDELIIANGKGSLLNATIVKADKKKTKVQITAQHFSERPFPRVTIAISPVKNSNRFEVFLEKAAEIGVSAIIPLLCKRTEKTHLKKERAQTILISAMVQSQQAWLPELLDPLKFEDVVAKEEFGQKYIAHCAVEEKQDLRTAPLGKGTKIILIGPEGDFTGDEINTAIRHHYLPVSLGNSRLRTETAGIVAAALLM